MTRIWLERTLIPLVALLGAGAFGVLALSRGEPVNALWLLTAAVCTYVIGYRLYAKFLASRVFALDDRRKTPAHKLENGRDFVPTGRWIVFGHHFAAIAGAGPLVGPILAVQFGYLPGMLWILVGVVVAGAVQDMVILVGSMRRDGKTLGQMAKDEMGPVAGFTALIAVLMIMTILLAVLALVVVKALASSPWGTFTIAMTIPIALLIGWYMRVLRPGKVIEATSIGVVLLMAALVGGQWVAAHPQLGPMFTFSGEALALMLIAYGFAASVLPVWLLLAPRDYLSTFVKIGTVVAMAVGIAVSAPMLQLPALTRFVDGTGPVVAGSLFPFVFITIACGAISGFHALVSSGTTPKLLNREGDARLVGYGGMLMESFVAVMALIAACVLQPGVYFAVNSAAGVVGATPDAAVATITGWGFPVTTSDMQRLATLVGEETLFARTGGAPTFALGMAQLFSQVLGGPAMMGLWYHFAIMFEALFILTTIDAGTRVGRFMVQDLLGHVWKPLGQVSWYPGVILTSALVVAGWGWFLYQGVIDPLGGINSLWPLFGIANQLLAAIALCVGTTILIKIHKARYMWVTLVPLAWVALVTFTAGFMKVFDPSPKIGFLAHRDSLAAKLASGAVPAEKIAETTAVMRNDMINAGMASMFLVMTALILVLSVAQWVRILRGKDALPLSEPPAEYHQEAEAVA
ncbi:MAG: carbon starvation CstA family protein [Candidatus Sericytochromatia bacterium]